MVDSDYNPDRQSPSRAIPRPHPHNNSRFNLQPVSVDNLTLPFITLKLTLSPQPQGI